MTAIAQLYGEATRSFIDLARSLDEEDWAAPCPCTPGWSVRDVLSHVSGIPDDGIHGRVDGVATEPWTASQVERNATFSVDELLDRWTDQYELFGAAIESMGEVRPVFDCHSHEHDVRHALGRPANRDSTVVAAMVERAPETLAEVPASLTIEFGEAGGGGDAGAERRLRVGAGGPDVTLRISPFEYFRSRLGRRSAAQLAAADWSGDPEAVEAVQAEWFLFGPTDVDRVE